MKPLLPLAVAPLGEKFGPGRRGAESLRERLEKRELTEPVSLQHPRELLLDEEGRAGGRYTFTQAALSQLCSEICVGLGSFIFAISGTRPSPVDTEDTAYSNLLAIRTINEAIKVRFEQNLKGSGIIVDPRAKLIEGIVGSRYHFYSNLELLDRAEEFNESNNLDAKFNGAVIEGRRVMLRYKLRKHTFAVPSVAGGPQEPFYTGWHFGNSEVGETQVTAAVTLVRGWGRTIAMMPFDSFDKVTHVRSVNFGKRLRRQIKKLQKAIPQAYALRKNILDLRDINLGLGKADHVARAKKLIGVLARKGVRRDWGAKIIGDVTLRGSYRREALPDDVERLSPDFLTAAKERTAFDLYNSISSMATTLKIAERERLEQLAYKLLHDYTIIV